MKTSRPYLENAYCPLCWNYWLVFAPSGIDESAPLECPQCHEMEGRLPVSDLCGDELRVLYARLDEEREKRQEARENPPEQEEDNE